MNKNERFNQLNAVSALLGEETLETVLMMDSRLMMLPLDGMASITVTLTSVEGVSLTAKRSGKQRDVRWRVKD
ncbi:MAG: hypothetical protein E6265_22220 [Enterobacteriaceae bacterium]|jgi:hypothetical protein|uniref:hypothetical protein n=1 Tax=Enterobacteriaceae TaxID=543 RepID=UPI0008933408|nr:hypothetical protein [Phytobacter diazotrophicus]AUU89754.1 hypothetical protein C2U55_12015 [Enterobacteriaceae bacterium ENNIH3]AUV10198.1 hypothetical protein C2U52_30095 [Enterobacteriaceae bacterium ENNIH2]MDU4999277.1 hypothetical protein [Enterobacteriaceae bacterium]PWF51737.1 hypothetical protein BHT19_0012635 [[Kluyvera] intestini]SLK13832.1 hypothetical protein SAMN03159434_11054 [Enterobacter sp. NFR05]